MTRIITFSIIALLFASCNVDKEEMRKKKLEKTEMQIVKLEKKRDKLLTAADTAVVEKVYPIKVEKVEIDTISRIANYTATLVPHEEVYLAPAQPGRIDAIYVEVGDKVKKGQKLALMDQTQLNQAKIQLAQLKTDFERMKTLKETNSISVQQFDQIKTQLEVTESNVEYLEENTVVIAPFNGVITGKYFENGEMYSGAPNTQAGKAAIVTIQQIDVLKAIINVSETYYPKLNKGDNINITTDLYPNQNFDGNIELIYPTVDALTRSFKVEIKVPNQYYKLRPGMFTRVKVQLEEVHTIVVPSIAVLQQEGTNKRFLFVEKNGLAKRIDVKLGQRFDEKLEVISNQLKAGDNLIVTGQANLMNNFKVKVTNK